MAHWRCTDVGVVAQAVALVYCAMFCYTLKCVIWRSPDYTRLYTLYTRLVCMGSLLRVVYFGIPDWVWGVPFVPTNFVRFGHAWWGNFVSFVVLMCMGNVFFYLSFVLLVYYWASVCEDSKAVPARLFKVVTGTFIAFYIFVVRAVLSLPTSMPHRPLTTHVPTHPPTHPPTYMHVCTR